MMRLSSYRKISVNKSTPIESRGPEQLIEGPFRLCFFAFDDCDLFLVFKTSQGGMGSSDKNTKTILTDEES